MVFVPASTTYVAWVDTALSASRASSTRRSSVRHSSWRHGVQAVAAVAEVGVDHLGQQPHERLRTSR